MDIELDQAIEGDEEFEKRQERWNYLTWIAIAFIAGFLIDRILSYGGGKLLN